MTRPIPTALRGLRVLCALIATGCAELVQYTDEVRLESAGRSQFVRAPAAVGGIVGFVAGVPVSIAASPISYGLYRYERSYAPLKADLASTLLFPSFVTWRAGTLALGAPFDVLEFAFWRAWQDPVSLSGPEREEVERAYDRAVLTRYPVRTVYPDEYWESRSRGAAPVGDRLLRSDADREPSPAPDPGASSGPSQDR